MFSSKLNLSMKLLSFNGDESGSSRAAVDGYIQLKHPRYDELDLLDWNKLRGSGRSFSAKISYLRAIPANCILRKPILKAL